MTGNFNRHRCDRTRWYSVGDDIASRALEDEGKQWFNVEVATACESILAGTLYQMLEDDLVKLLAIGEKPLCRVNKADLARMLSCSPDTVQRAYQDMVQHGFVVKNGIRYSIPGLTVPKQLQQSISKTAAKSDRVVKQIAARSDQTTAQSDRIAARSDEKAARSDNDTHSYITTLRYVSAEPVVSCADADDAGASFCNKQEFIRHELTSMAATLSLTQQEECNKFVPTFAHDLVESSKDNEEYGFTAEPRLALALRSAMKGNLEPYAADILTDVTQHGQVVGWSRNMIRFCYLRNLEALPGLLPEQAENPALPSKEKAALLMADIRHHNSAGWPLYSSRTVEYCFSTKKGQEEAFGEHFEAHPELTANDVWKVLADCIEINQMEDKPSTGWDKYYFARGGNTETLNAKWITGKWDEIQEDLRRFRE